MRDIHRQLADWCASKRRFAMATVIAVTGSAPRPPGTVLAVDTEGAAIGGVSGGCVEGAVYQLCQEVLASGIGVRRSYGYSDAEALAVGLTCGGTVEVFVSEVDPDDPALAATLSAVEAGTAVAWARIADGRDQGRGIAVTSHGVHGTTGDPALDTALRAPARAALSSGGFRELHLADRRVVIDSHRPPPRLLVFGAVDFAAAVARAGKFLGHHVTVCDARPVFATRARFPEADEVIVDWPHRFLDTVELDESAAICVLTHDAKFDVPLLLRALRLPVGYIGAMGSARTHHDRLARLAAAGATETELARLHSPIGLDLGGHTPEETALSILAEIVAVRHGASAGFLTGAAVPIHHDQSI